MQRAFITGNSDPGSGLIKHHLAWPRYVMVLQNPDHTGSILVAGVAKDHPEIIKQFVDSTCYMPADGDINPNL